MDYRIKADASKIASMISPDAGSAELLKDILVAIAAEPDNQYCANGMISEQRFLEIVRDCIPEPITCENWVEYHVSDKICFENTFCGANISLMCSFGDDRQNIESASFETMFGKGRYYRVEDDGIVKEYRQVNTYTLVNERKVL
jgi:hypothetical protein